MKRKILISTLLFLTGLVTHAQDLDIKPSQQAQGILESKNGMVDHATGLFHYKVPLYEIKSGSFTLPISIDYVAKGVKVDDVFGVIGYNWTFNTGGIVTRTVRGGIADEERGGFICNTSSSNPKEDLESDIFTASINGKKVNFIIENYGDEIIVELLERTNVKIEVIHDFGQYERHIYGWVITDENGDIYTLKQIEYTTNFTREVVVGSNGINNKTYASSWYITEIKPLNCPLITFEYIEDVKPIDDVQDSVYLISKQTTYSSLFNYGAPIYDRPFDFKKYKDKFDMQIKSANEYIKLSNIQNQLDLALYKLLCAQTGTFFNPSIETPIYVNFKILGMLRYFSKVTAPSNEAISLLNLTINLYKNSSNINERLAATDLQVAKSQIVNCLLECNNLYSKEDVISSAYQIKSPLLSKIKYSGKSLLFDYDISVEYSDCKLYELKEITQYDEVHNRINGVKLSLSTLHLLDKISFLDLDNREYDNLKFNYHLAPNDRSYFTDYWGYKTDNSYEKYNTYPNIYYAQDLSLSKITTSKGGTIELKYETNKIAIPTSNPDIIGYKSVGGIRVAKIALKNTKNNSADTIKYKYPNHAISLYESFNNKDTVNYLGFSDVVTYDRVQNKGNVYINYGNNGFYYPYVVEEYVGKGAKAYKFAIPDSGDNLDLPNFWEYGLPLSIAQYDTNYKLKNLMNYKYSFYGFNKIRSWVKRNMYYIDRVKVEAQFKEEPNIYVTDGSTHYLMIPYDDIYMLNIYPRTNLIDINSSYVIPYNGKVLLNEQIEYSFENETPNYPSHDDFNRTSANVKKVNYEYDLLIKSMLPIKITETNSNGNQTIEVIKRVTNVSNNIPIISKMKNKNMFENVIKSQKITRKANSDIYILREEKVFDYIEETFGTENAISLNKIHTCNPNKSITISFNDATLLDPDNLYRTEEVKYHSENEYLLPIYTENWSDKMIMNYNFHNGELIFKSPNSELNSTSSTSEKNIEMKEVKAIKTGTNYRLYILIKSGDYSSKSFTYKIKHSGGIETKNIAVDGRQHEHVAIIDIDLKNYTNVSSISMTVPNYSFVDYVAIVPEDCMFEAIKYNNDGTVFCKFDQNGQGEYYTYDSVGRLKDIHNLSDGSFLKSFSYNNSSVKIHLIS